MFLRALGLRSSDEIIRAFYSVDTVYLRNNAQHWAVADSLVGQRARRDVRIADVSINEGKKITKAHLEGLRRGGVKDIEVTDEALQGAYTAADIVDPGTGEVLLEANEELTARVISLAHEKRGRKSRSSSPSATRSGRSWRKTFKKDPIRTHEEALIEIYRRLRPGDPPTLDSSRSLFENMFFNPQKYDFSRVGRLKLNTKLGLNTPLDEKILHPQDFYEVIKFLLKLPQERGRGGRHRPPREPPRPLCRRAAREPVPHRSGPDGGRHRGEDVGLPGNGSRHAARPDQRQAGDGRDSRVLRVVAAVPNSWTRPTRCRR